MNDSEFIELLNLYVDQEITAADAARLEAEVQANPARRQTYQDYCRMQKACKLLAQDFQTSATPAGDRKVVAFDPTPRRDSRTGWVAAAGTLAAAACLALVFVNRDRTAVGTTPAFVAQETPVQIQAPATVAEQGITRGIVHAVSVPPAQPAMVGNPLFLSSRAHADAMLAATAEQANGQFEWMRTVHLPPLQQSVPLETLRIETQTIPADGSRTYSSPQAGKTQVEWIGFQFNK